MYIPEIVYAFRSTINVQISYFTGSVGFGTFPEAESRSCCQEIPSFYESSEVHCTVYRICFIFILCSFKHVLILSAPVFLSLLFPLCILTEVKFC